MDRFRHFGASIAVLVIGAAFTACFRQEVVTRTLNVPQMGHPECVERVIQILTLPDPEAIIEIAPDLEQRTVSVTYVSTRMALKNIEHLLADAGFDVNEVIGNRAMRATLPESCR